MPSRYDRGDTSPVAQLVRLVRPRRLRCGITQIQIVGAFPSSPGFRAQWDSGVTTYQRESGHENRAPLAVSRTGGDRPGSRGLEWLPDLRGGDDPTIGTVLAAPSAILCTLAGVSAPARASIHGGPVCRTGWRSGRRRATTAARAHPSRPRSGAAAGSVSPIERSSLRGAKPLTSLGQTLAPSGRSR
jgi:hypothetical protein